MREVWPVRRPIFHIFHIRHISFPALRFPSFRFFLIGLLALLVLLASAVDADAQSRRRKRSRSRSGKARRAAVYRRPAVPAVSAPPPGPIPAPRARSARSDFYKPIAPRMSYIRPDTTVEVRVEEMPEDSSDATESVYFNPARELNIVNTDTSTLDLGLEDQQIVEMSQEVLVDSTWIKVAGYYAIWDSRYINPYRVDGRELRDTVHLFLVDSARGRYAAMPLPTTPTTSGFGPRWGRWHYGDDIDCETGDTIRAAFDGVVRVANWDGSGYGNHLVLRHYNGLETLYGHLSRAFVKVGDFVTAGDPIGLGGSTGRSTGSHLHYETRYEGNPFDPGHIYDFSANRLSRAELDVTARLFDYFHRAARSAWPGQIQGGRTVMYHKVRQGDILGKISRRYHVSIAQLCRLNGITPKTTLRLGRNLRIR
jgi:murein DD-endopeptidase MepM/ murein hydrolase activator NlpD